MLHKYYYHKQTDLDIIKKLITKAVQGVLVKYKLYLVEGLPGTGKTTLSERLHTLLIKKGIKSELLLEDDKKIPCNFCDIAGIPKIKAENYQIDRYVIKETENYFYVNLNECGQETAGRIKCYDIGDEFNKHISVQEYVNCTLEWWEHWTTDNIKDSVLILDSAFMQCPINEMIIRGAADPEISAYINSIAEIIKPYTPVCIYLNRGDAKTAIDFAKKAKGEEWTKGIERLAEIGCSNLFERRFDLENKLLPVIPGIICNINGNDWSDVEVKLSEII